MLDPKCKKCRRAGQKLFLKGEKCLSQKCPVIRRPYAPGIHGKSFRRRSSEYGQQLAEKQRIRLSYCVSEKQFKNYFKQIANLKGNKEELLIQKLENRLDNVVFRLGWAKSRNLARQMISHGHILVNGRKTNISSYQVRKNDVIKIKEKSKSLVLFKDLKTELKKHEAPKWLSSDKEKIEAKVIGLAKLEDLGQIGAINKIIEFYSR